MSLPENPVSSLISRSDKAKLVVVSDRAKNKFEVPFKFNPSELQFSKQNTFAEIGIPGLVAPPIQYVRGASEKLSFEALVDTTDTDEDVRAKYVTPLRSLLNIDIGLHAPPVVKFEWNNSANGTTEAPRNGDYKDHFEFVGVIESLNVSYTLFAKDGKPLRAKLSISLKEFTTVEEQAERFRKESPDVEKTYVVRRGDTLSSIAQTAFGDGKEWRRIATANRIHDPRILTPGQVLLIPRLT